MCGYTCVKLVAGESLDGELTKAAPLAAVVAAAAIAVADLCRYRY
nr:unnamed protein product [Digitaria exilis]